MWFPKRVSNLWKILVYNVHFINWNWSSSAGFIPLILPYCRTNGMRFKLPSSNEMVRKVIARKSKFANTLIWIFLKKVYMRQRGKERKIWRRASRSNWVKTLSDHGPQTQRLSRSGAEKNEQIMREKKGEKAWVRRWQKGSVVKCLLTLRQPQLLCHLQKLIGYLASHHTHKRLDLHPPHTHKLSEEKRTTNTIKRRT